jgi:hypothetical protein
MPGTASLPAFVPNPRSRVHRHPECAYYDRETVFAILDAALLCHIGYVIDGPALCDADSVLARGQAPLLARFLGQPHAADAARRHPGLRNG